MGVSLSYLSTKSVPPAEHRQLLALVGAADEAYAWWCEPIWFSEETDEACCAFGRNKLFCMIDDEDTDTYMAFLDICEIVKILSSVTQQLGIEWRLAIEDDPFGGITKTGPDSTLQDNLSGFLEWFPGDFDSLRSRPREEILAEWADR